MGGPEMVLKVSTVFSLNVSRVLPIIFMRVFQLFIRLFPFRYPTTIGSYRFRRYVNGFTTLRQHRDVDRSMSSHTDQSQSFFLIDCANFTKVTIIVQAIKIYHEHPGARPPRPHIFGR